MTNNKNASWALEGKSMHISGRSWRWTEKLTFPDNIIIFYEEKRPRIFLTTDEQSCSRCKISEITSPLIAPQINLFPLNHRNVYGKPWVTIASPRVYPPRHGRWDLVDKYFENIKGGGRWYPAIKTCFMSRLAFQFEFNILGNMRKYEEKCGNMNKYEGENMKKYKGKMKKYVEITKKLWRIMKKCSSISETWTNVGPFQSPLAILDGGKISKFLSVGSYKKYEGNKKKYEAIEFWR